jgi:alpha-L-fucosidase
MKTSLLTRFAVCALGLTAAGTLPAADPAPPFKPNLPIAPGAFQGTMDSLKQYQCPDWFRDAKFGIWAHWGPQAVPMMGDWYAKHIYVQGHPQYNHHLATYGHPSTNGYKEIIQLWKAEKWDPDRLMSLYKRAGARYFVSMGSHHDNFYLWDSKLHEYNAVQMGPKRDVVGDWQKAAQKYGLRFGVSEHLGASFSWFQDSHKSDRTGPLAGVPYDGANPKYQELYHFPAEANDRGWYSNNPRWQQQWFDRIKELVDNYHPDLLYTDGGVPFGNEVGRSLIAHLYNTDATRHGGKPEVIYTCKQRSEGRWIEDLERGVMAKVNPDPWQTDTSIGDWYYNKNWKFRPVSWTIYMLVDIVSKNGNLLLNVVQRPDGSLDPEVEKMREQMADWITVHGEAIYGTRPWLVYGEGRIKAKGGSFGEDFNFSSLEIRFTTKGQTLYATALGWPKDGQLLVRSLAKPVGESGNAISSVSLLGYDGKVEWTQTTNGLAVTLPDKQVSEFTCSLKITGTDLKPVQAAAAPSAAVRPDAKGSLTLLPDDAELHGDQIKTETQGGQANIGFWDNGNDWVSWRAQIGQAGSYKVSVSLASLRQDAECVVEVAGQQFSVKPPATGNWATFRVLEIGSIEIKQAGEQGIKVRAKDPKTWRPLNLRFVKLTKE